MFIEVNPDFRDNVQSLAGTSGSEKKQVPIVYCQVFLLYVISGLSLSKTSLPFSLQYLARTAIILILLLTLCFLGQTICSRSPGEIPPSNPSRLEPTQGPHFFALVPCWLLCQPASCDHLPYCSQWHALC